MSNQEQNIICEVCLKNTDNDGRVCAGEIAYEIGKGCPPIVDYRGMLTCNCCDDCRRNCHKEALLS